MEKGTRSSRGKPRAGSRGKQQTTNNSNISRVEQEAEAPVREGGGSRGSDSSLGGKMIGDKSNLGGDSSSAKKKRKKKNTTNTTPTTAHGSTGDKDASASSSTPQQQKNTKDSSSSSVTTTITSTSVVHKEHAAPKATTTTTTNNYAWSAFQSSPDPSALPDIGGLFGNDDDNNNDNIRKGMAEGVEERKKLETHEERGEKEEEEEEGGHDEDNDADAGRNSLNLGSPSADIRSSLVHSMIAKNERNVVNTGQELLHRLQVGHENGGGQLQQSLAIDKTRNTDGIDRRFRTMESLEAELMSTPQKDGSKANQETKDEANRDDEAAANNIETRRSSTTNGSEERGSIYQYRDPIMELMNPGGHPGGFGMPMHHHHHQPHPPVPYHPPLHYGGMHPHQPPQQHPQHMSYHHLPPPSHHHPMQQHSYPGYPYPSPAPPPMYQSPNTLPPGFTTMQVRVPTVLGPGNTMLVHGMSFAVPEGVPSGAIIPVMIPIHPPGGGQYPNPNMHPDARQYGINYNYQHAQQQQHPRMIQHTNIPPPHMMGGYYPNHNPHEQYTQSQLQQQQAQQPPAEANPNSWASKVAVTSQSKITESNTVMTGHEMGLLPAPANSASASAPDSVATSGVGKGGRSRTKKEGSTGAGTGGTSDNSKDEGVPSNAKRTGRKKQQQQKEGKGDYEHGIKLVSNGAKKDSGRK